MKHQEGYLKGVRDTDIYYQYWLPESEPKAILLVVHGLAEHSGRYMNGNRGRTLNYKKGHMRSEVHKTINCCINIHCSRRLSQRSRKLLEVIK